jgi:uncharacterized protein
MRLSRDGWTFSPTDVATFVRCQHAIQLRKQSREGTLKAFAGPSSSIRTEMLARRGGEHEDAYVESLRAQQKSIVEISRDDDDATAKTLDAMRDGADIVVQAALQHEGWLGYADLLERVPLSSTFGDWSYEVADTKLSMSVQPYFILQLGIYSEILESLQGSAPQSLHLILGDGTRHTFACNDYSAYLARVRSRFLSAFQSDVETLPYPVDYCGLCEWNRHCWLHLVELDHLSLVANINRDQVKRLQTAGIDTLTALGQANPKALIPNLAASTFERLHHQARLQLEHRQTGKHRYEFLDPEERRGFQILPKPSAGDLFFDIEADPFEDLTYLFGVAWSDGEERRYRPFWAHTPEEERQAFEAVVDLIVEMRAAHPEGHVYHYGAIEVTTLKKLMGRYGTREEAIDSLLKQDAFVDLLSVVRQSLRISHPSYSLKKVETFYREREADGVIDAGGAIVAYENWLLNPQQEQLDEIESYNQEDCLSTLELRTWLVERKQELEASRNIQLAWREPRTPEPTREELEQERLETDVLSGQLIADLPDNRTTWDDDHRARWTLANLLHYHRREDRPDWWAFFDRLKMSPEELIDDRESIGMLTLTGRTREVANSIATEFAFEPQQHKLDPGDAVGDPHRVNERGWPAPAGTVESLDSDAGFIELKTREGFSADALPRAIVPTGSVDKKKLRAALRRVAQIVLEEGLHGTSFSAARDILLRTVPRIREHTLGERLHGEHVDLEELKSVARRLDRSCLFIQGPPGSGKTHDGARIIIDLISHGSRVGISAGSHKAIENMLHEVEKVANEAGVTFRGLKISSEKSQSFHSRLTNPKIVDSKDSFPRGQKPDPTDHAIRLLAGTQWCFSSPEHAQQFDVLIIDEAGQMSLADALAAATSAKNVILLGDPLQLAQVSQGIHPDNCGLSVLEHLLGDDKTIPPERGIFLERTWRMHPAVCKFISEVVYDCRLESEEGCATRHVRAAFLSGTGLRYRAIEHEGNSTDSIEEASWIAEAIASMLPGGLFTDRDGTERSLRPEDLMVVTPYNAQVRMIQSELQKRGLVVRVGTVDKFQGQEAPVIFFSMATSSGEDIPRSLEFLFSRNRLNVAISRAQCLAILVASPKLLDVDCRTVEQMKLVNALCRFAEMATLV